MSTSSNSSKNRLNNAKSPYLLQHENNPVAWYEWGPEAFAASKEQDKPVLLSVGYAACHWVGCCDAPALLVVNDLLTAEELIPPSAMSWLTNPSKIKQWRKL